jgi:hypothetical protein
MSTWKDSAGHMSVLRESIVFIVGENCYMVPDRAENGE